MKKNKQTIQNAGQDAQQMELSYISGGNIKWYSNFGKQLGTFL